MLEGGVDKPEATQSDKVKEAARALECDDDRERVGKLVKLKPVEKPSELGCA
jgi:hypothetical protein